LPPAAEYNAATPIKPKKTTHKTINQLIFKNLVNKILLELSVENLLLL
jgi:hypothetical protein